MTSCSSRSSPRRATRCSTRASTRSSSTRGANKTQIKQAVQAVFSVKVTGVNTINRQGKRKRTKTGFGKRADSKRAIVTLAEGDRIDIFGGRPPNGVGSVRISDED